MLHSRPRWRPSLVRASGVVPLAIAVVTALALPAAALGPSAPDDGIDGAGSVADPVAVRTIATFDHAAAQTPENLVVHDGVVVVSLAFASTLVVLTPDGATLQALTIDTRGGFIAGLVVDPNRRSLAVSVSSPDANVAGVWSIPLRGHGTGQRLGTPYRLAALPGGAFPNGVALAPSGDLYIADSLLSTIWRVPGDGSRPWAPGAPAQAWLVDPALAPSVPGLPGANGIKVHAGRLYVTNTGRSTLLSIPLDARPSVTVVRDDLRIDDIAFDARGTLYAALNQANSVVRTRPAAGAPVQVLASEAAGIHNPSALAFADDDDAGQGIYVTNAAFDGPTPPPSLQLLTEPEGRS